MGTSPPRLAQVLTYKQHKKLKQLIPHGDRRRVFSVLIDGLIDLLETDQGPYVLGAIISGRVKIQTVLDSGIPIKPSKNEPSAEL